MLRFRSILCARAMLLNLGLAVCLASLAHPSAAQIPEWGWVGGSNLPNQTGVYCTGAGCLPDTFGEANSPGARYEAATWTDPSGRLWLYGGWGYGAVGPDAPTAHYGGLNDLWVFDPTRGAHGEWAFVSGSYTPKANGDFVEPVYGTEYQFDPANTPGSRGGESTCTDRSGRLWLF